uniref:AB hydrolase-1 domain-containing protein n=1 Tax=Timspurckia oligopyrenoides TaxID=708627 RepID=A0A7S0ZAH2_9RHOD
MEEYENGNGVVGEVGLADVELRVAVEGVSELLPTTWGTQQRSEQVGAVQVTIIGDESKTPLITIHDIGMDAISCFKTFLNHCVKSEADCPQLFHTCQYHIEMPGHHRNAQRLPDSSAWMDLNELADSVHRVVDHFKLLNVFMLGVGAGCEIVARYALSHKNLVRCLILISPSFCEASYYEQYSFRFGAGYKWLGNSELPPAAKALFEERWFGDNRSEIESSETIGRSKRLMSLLSAELDSLQPDNVLRYAYANAMRSAVSHRLVELAGTSILLILGKNSWMHDEAISAFEEPNEPRVLAKSVSRVIISHSGALPHMEHPDQVANAIRLFFQGHSIVS